MSTTSENNKRIAKNTLFLYIRMLLIMGVSLYTSRVVLRVLGVEDFGIYNVVGGVVSIMSFFVSSLSNVSQRYMNIGLGKQDLQETEYAFRQSFTLMCLLSVILLLLGETLGLWFVCNKLVVPPERLEAAVWVYQFSLISILSAINQVPLIGAIVAHERMNMYAYLGLFEVCARLLTVYLLEAVGTFDSLILYGMLTALISVITWSFYAIYCVRVFSECKLRLYWDHSLVNGMSRFIGQNLFGCFAWSAGVQGTNILLNLFFGPTVNAARAVSVQVSTVVTRFTENIMTAVKPQIIKSYASGDHEYMIILIEKSSKYAYFLAAILAIPVMVEIEFILGIWLGQVPEYTISFTRLVLCESLIGVFIPPLWIAANATGGIKNSQVYGRMFTLAILPISYLLLRLNADPLIPFVVAVFANVGYWLYCLYDIHKQIQLNISRYLQEVVKPAFVFSLSLIFVGFILVLIIPEDSFFRLWIVLVFMVFVGVCVIYSLLSIRERKIFYAMFKKICSKKL